MSLCGLMVSPSVVLYPPKSRTFTAPSNLIWLPGLSVCSVLTFASAFSSDCAPHPPNSKVALSTPAPVTFTQFFILSPPF